jgi:hypothetical protein
MSSVSFFVVFVWFSVSHLLPELFLQAFGDSVRLDMPRSDRARIPDCTAICHQGLTLSGSDVRAR